MTLEQIKKDAIQYIESTFFYLVSRVNSKDFEKTIQQNIDIKRNSVTTSNAFWDSLMLNIVYFAEHTIVWKTILKEFLQSSEVLTVSHLENELLAQQMRIRQQVAEKMDAYTEQFHEQYPKLTEEVIIYDYAYHSVEHALRVDVLTYFAMHSSQSSILLQADTEECLHVIEGLIAYHVDALVQQMKLK